ncbi:hypothetical protein [Psychroserpens jangbogonensis]|uniref:hypothetical protein n=1 Tax=Psychroserpens jangbogonensis TaxID=1484460 RepID=UPI00053F06E8|nr:hypothetical protein [Psychroserpens jangbogonensis]
MKKTTLYIIAIPLGLVASIFLPIYFSKILHYFSPIEGITEFFDNYLITIFGGYIGVFIPALIVPKHKIIFGFIMLAICIISSFYMYSKGDDFNYLFVIGGLLGLIVGTQFSKFNAD